MLQENYWLIVGVVAMVGVSLLAWRLHRRRGQKSLRQLYKAINVLANHNQQMADVVVPDEIDGEVHIDYVLNTDRAVVVLVILDYPGLIFASEQIEQWTQVQQQRSDHFQNPLPRLQTAVSSMQALLPGVPVVGRVVFSDSSQFPKGQPAEAVLAAELLQSVRAAEAGMAPMERPAARFYGA
jgi:hypothetical protein